MNKKNGISLISLIITIIVIIILAAIVIFTGLGTPDNANFAAYVSEFSDFNLAVTNDFMNRKAKYAISNQTRSDAQIYYIIASGTEIDMNDATVPTGTVSELGLNLMPEQLVGNEYYEITSDKNVLNWDKEKTYFAETEKHYVTDEGETFMLPGYLVEEDDGTQKWWINERMYYVSNTPIKGPTSVTVSGLAIKDGSGTDVTDTTVEEGTELYISFEASEDGAAVTVSPTLPYKVTANGTYTFTLTGAGGRTKTYTVTVDNFKVPSIADTLKVGDYVEYTPDSSTYSTNADNTGYTSQDLETGTANWRVLYIDDSTGEVLITTNGIVNSGTYLSGTKGYFRGATELNNICAALYSNSSLGVTARSMTVEDLDKACGITDPTSVYSTYGEGYAYYPNGTTFDEGDTTIEYNGKTYTKTAHGYSTAKFYAYDGGGKETTDSNGFTYSTPEAGNPVFVTRSYYNYSPSSKNSTVGNILGSSYGWLASPCVRLYSSYAYFYVRYASSSDVDAYFLYYSLGNAYSPSYGVRPLVSLGSTLQIDDSDTTRDGSSAGTAWKIIKK